MGEGEKRNRKEVDRRDVGKEGNGKRGNKGGRRWCYGL